MKESKLKYDYVEYYVGMAKLVAYWHVNALGFEVIGYSGVNRGNPDEISFLLVKNDIKIIITSAATPNNYQVVSFVDRHGNGVRSISLKTHNIEKCVYQLSNANAIFLGDIYEKKDELGTIRCIDVKLFDDNVVTYSDYSEYNGSLLPGFVEAEFNWGANKIDSQLLSIDHIACALRENESALWENYVNKIFGSDTVVELKKGQIENSNSGMQLKLLRNSQKSINNVLVEPDGKMNKSQIQQFLDGNYGTGIQHIAFDSDNIFETIKSLKKSGAEFVTFPTEYFDSLEEQHPSLDVEKLREHNVLCEIKNDTFLLQTFTLPIGDRPTFFYEIIQRVNDYDGFGIGNITALFDAVERSLKKENEE